MKPRQLKRLHNLVQVLRDAAKNSRLRRLFTVHKFGYGKYEQRLYPKEVNLCGTPACALGHYAARRDVQHTFVLDRDGDVMIGQACVDFDNHIPVHFGITGVQAKELFDSDGCDRARTPTQAANYIERFIKRVTV